MTTIYWLENPNILFDKNYISEVWPSDDMTYTEKMNSLSRLIIFLSLFGLVIFRKLSILIVGLAILAIMTYLYNQKVLNGKGINIDNNETTIDNKKKETKEGFVNSLPWKDNEGKVNKISKVSNKNPLNNHLLSDSKGTVKIIKNNNDEIINNNSLLETIRSNSEKENNIVIKDNLENNFIMDRNSIQYNKVPDYDVGTIKYLIGNTGYVKDSIFKEKKENYIK